MSYHGAGLSLFFVLLFSGCATTTDEGLLGKSSVFSAPVVVSSECGNFLVRLTFERQSQTSATYSVYITDLFGQPFADATRVILAFTPLDQDDENTVTLVAHPSSQKAGMYVPNGTYTPSPGSWKIEAVVRRTQPPDVLCIFHTDL
ncbi:MAG: hypothetical protein AB7G75_32790 [Candidatus Binatia bacterium]